MAPIAVATVNDGERIGRLEERMDALTRLLEEIRAEQKALSEIITRAGGGLRVLVVLGAVAGAWGVMRDVAHAVTTWAAR